MIWLDHASSYEFYQEMSNGKERGSLYKIAEVVFA